MSEQPEKHFELVLHTVHQDTDVAKVKGTLAKFLKTDENALEKTLVKIKVFHGKSQTLKTGLSEAEAKRYKTFLTKVGLEISIAEEMALVPIQKEAIKDHFECPACGAKNSVPEGEIQICTECGIVKEKYEAQQIRKKEEAEKLEQLRQLELEEKKAKARSVKQSFVSDQEERREREFRKRMKRYEKKNVALLASMLIGTGLLAAGGYWYYNMPGSDKAEVAEEQPPQQDITVTGQKGLTPAEALEKINKLAAMAPSGMLAKAAVSSSDLPSAGLRPVVSNDGSLESMYKELSANPIEAELNQLPALDHASTPEYLNQVKHNKSTEMSLVDKASVENISSLYNEANPDQGILPNFSTIRSATNNIQNKHVKAQISRFVAWDEISSGNRTLEDYGAEITPRPGEDLKGVMYTYRLIDLYNKDSEFFQAEKMAHRLEDKYLQSVALTRIVRSAAVIDKDVAEFQRNKIAQLADNNNMQADKKALILGMLSIANHALKDQAANQITRHKLNNALLAIQNPQKKFSTLLQLSEDLREIHQFREAHRYTERAHQLLEHKIDYFSDLNSAYSHLAEQYMNLFEFDRAKALLVKMDDETSKLALYETLMLMEKHSRT